MDPILIILLKGLLASLSLFFLFWIISLVMKNPSIIDVCWGLGFMLLAYVYIVNGAGWTLRNNLMFGLVVFWGVRIAFFVFKRLEFGKIEDHRYTKIREAWKPYVRFNFLVFFFIQSLIVVLCSLPLLYISVNTSTTLSFFDVLGFIICLISIIGEAIADQQLESFKKSQYNTGKVCEVGLWNYSRHPNYFFEFTIWLAFFIFALGSPYGIISIISPLIVLHLVLNVSGIPLAEKLSLKSRGEAYKKYQQSTSAFMPLPKRKI